MTNFNLLILPVLGAFYFIETNYYYKVKYSLHDRQRYIYTSFLFAFYLLIPSFVIAAATKKFLPEFSYFILKNVPIKEQFIGTSLLSFIVGVLIAHITNWLSSKEKILKKLVEKYGGDAERLIQECFYQKELISLTLKNEKVYIGFITKFKATLDNTYVFIDPVFSGYRDDKKQMVLTTDYLEAFEVYDSFFREGEEKPKAADKESSFTQLLIKKEEIRTFSKFDLDLYMAFNEVDQNSGESDA